MGAIGAVGLAGLIGGLMVGRCSADPGHAAGLQAAGRLERAAVPPATAQPSVEPTLVPIAAVEAAPSSGAASGPEGARRFKGPPYTDGLEAERALVRRGRHALVAGNLAAALDALEEHARRFPDGQSVADREKLWSETCARLRGAGAEGDAVGADARCAGRP